MKRPRRMFQTGTFSSVPLCVLCHKIHVNKGHKANSISNKMFPFCVFSLVNFSLNHSIASQCMTYYHNH